MYAMSGGIISSLDEDESSTARDGSLDKAVVVNDETFESSSSDSGNSSEEGGPSRNCDEHTLPSTPAISNEVRRRRLHFLVIVAFLPLLVASATLGAFLVSERDDTLLPPLTASNSSTAISTPPIDEPKMESSSLSPSRAPSYLRATMAPTLTMVTDTNTTSVVCLTSGVCENSAMCCSGECIQDDQGGNVCAASSSNTTTTQVVVVGKETKKQGEKPKNQDTGKHEAVVAKEKKDTGVKNVVDDKAEREYWNRWVTDDELSNMN